MDKKKKMEEAFLNSLPSKFKLSIPVFAHFEVPFDRKCSWVGFTHPIMNLKKKKKKKNFGAVHTSAA